MCRYLASGADDSSVWLEVTRIEGRDVVCEAKNSTELSGALVLAPGKPVLAVSWRTLKMLVTAAVLFKGHRLSRRVADHPACGAP